MKPLLGKGVTPSLGQGIPGTEYTDLVFANLALEDDGGDPGLLLLEGGAVEYLKLEGA